MLNATQMTEVTAKVKQTNQVLTALAAFDFSPAYELDARLKNDKKLLAEFVKDPEGVAKREVGLQVQPGFHLHFINENNEYLPPENDAISQLQAGNKIWSRVEIRSAVGPGCVAYCGICW